jgi:hypothetical protein
MAYSSCLNRSLKTNKLLLRRIDGAIQLRSHVDLTFEIQKQNLFASEMRDFLALWNGNLLYFFTPSSWLGSLLITVVREDWYAQIGWRQSFAIDGCFQFKSLLMERVEFEYFEREGHREWSLKGHIPCFQFLGVWSQYKEFNLVLSFAGILQVLHKTDGEEEWVCGLL